MILNRHQFKKRAIRKALVILNEIQVDRLVTAHNQAMTDPRNKISVSAMTRTLNGDLGRKTDICRRILARELGLNIKELFPEYLEAA